MMNEIRTEAVAKQTATEARSPEARDDASTRTLPLTPAPTAAREKVPEADLLLAPQKRDQLREAWLEIQSSFVDEPGESVRKADELVQTAMNSVSERFEAARRDLAREWDRGEEASTETLRLALRSYRVLFNRLLAF